MSGQTVSSRPESMDNLKYCRPSDIITRNGNITTNGTVSSDANYGLSALYDQLPSKPLKLDESGDIYIDFDFLEPVRLDAVAVPNHNLDVGLNCRVKLCNDGDFGTPDVDAPIVPGAVHLDGHRASPWVDLTKRSGYIESGFQFLRFEIPTNSVAVKIGELLVISQLREFTRWPQWRGNKGRQRRFLEALETEYGVTRVHRRRIKQRFFSFELQLDVQDWQDLNDLSDDAGGLALPWFCTADGGKEDDEGLYVRFTKETAARLEATEDWYDIDTFNLSVLELSRSLPFGLVSSTVEAACS